MNEALRTPASDAMSECFRAAPRRGKTGMARFQQACAQRGEELAWQRRQRRSGEIRGTDSAKGGCWTCRADRTKSERSGWRAAELAGHVVNALMVQCLGVTMAGLPGT